VLAQARAVVAANMYAAHVIPEFEPYTYNHGEAPELKQMKSAVNSLISATQSQGPGSLSGPGQARDFGGKELQGLNNNGAMPQKVNIDISSLIADSRATSVSAVYLPTPSTFYAAAPPPPFRPYICPPPGLAQPENMFAASTPSVATMVATMRGLEACNEANNRVLAKLVKHATALTGASPSCMFACYHLHALGLSSQEILMEHFSNYGVVDGLYVAHTKEKFLRAPDAERLTIPGDVGIVVMTTAGAVDKIMGVGAQQHVAGFSITLQPLVAKPLTVTLRDKRDYSQRTGSRKSEGHTTTSSSEGSTLSCISEDGGSSESGSNEQ